MKQHRQAPLRQEDFWIGKDGLDIGIYKTAWGQAKTVSMLLEEMKSEKQGKRSPYVGMTKAEVIKLKQEMRKAGQTPPDTALEESFKQAGIYVSGKYTDYVSKFFEISDTDVLFPEFISDRVYAGLLKTSLVSEFVMSETNIDSLTFQKLYLEDDEEDRQLRDVGKMEDLPETRIEVGDQIIRLNRYGRYVKMPMEDLKYQRANVFGKFMERVGTQIGIDQTDLMLYRLINGDGNTGTTPGTTVTAAASGAGELSLNDAISWALGLPTPYMMDKFVFRKANVVKWFGRLYDATTTSIGFKELNIVPKVYEWDRSVITTNYGWGVDSRYAIEFVTNGGIQTDVEKLVRQTAQGTAIYTYYEFAIADANAVARWDLSS